MKRLRFQPLDEGAARLAAPTVPVTALVSYEARDEFTGPDGPLAGSSASKGGVWAGVGDPNDFEIPVSSSDAGLLVRTAVSDPTIGRIDTLPVTLASCAVQVDLMFGAGGPNLGVVARFVDVDNAFIISYSASAQQLQFKKLVGGSSSDMGEPIPEAAAVSWHTLQLYVDDFGRWFVWFYPQGGPPGLPVWSGQDDDLVNGGQLEEGEPGIWDRQTSATPVDRFYRNFQVLPAPNRDAVIYADGACELRTDGCFRGTLDTNAWGPTGPPVGDLLRLPPSGLEERPVEIFLKASRGDFDRLPDPADDNLQAEGFYRPSWLTVPG